MGLVRDRIYVVGERERDDVRVEPIDHRRGLLSRARMRLVYGYIVTRFRFPVRRKQRIVVLVQLTGRIVRDVQER